MGTKTKALCQILFLTRTSSLFFTAIRILPLARERHRQKTWQVSRLGTVKRISRLLKSTPSHGIAAMTYVLSRTVDYGNGGCVGFSPNFLFNLRQFLPQNRVFRVDIKFSPYYNTTNPHHNQEVLCIVYIFRLNLSDLTKSDRILQKKKHLKQRCFRNQCKYR